MLGPYNTGDYPITIVVASLINIVVPLLSPYCYFVCFRVQRLLYAFPFSLMTDIIGISIPRVLSTFGWRGEALWTPCFN